MQIICLSTATLSVLQNLFRATCLLLYRTYHNTLQIIFAHEYQVRVKKKRKCGHGGLDLKDSMLRFVHR
jgi:hypothetical protein